MAKPQQMSGQPDTSDDLIAELAKLMATNAKGDAGPGAQKPQSVPVKAAPADSKPAVRIPGFDMPPLTMTPFDAPPRPKAPTPSAPGERPAVRIPGMDLPPLNVSPTPPQSKPAEAPAPAPVAAAPAPEAKVVPQVKAAGVPDISLADEAKPVPAPEPKPAAAPVQRFEPRIIPAARTEPPMSAPRPETKAEPRSDFESREPALGPEPPVSRQSQPAQAPAANTSPPTPQPQTEPDAADSDPEDDPIAALISAELAIPVAAKAAPAAPVVTAMPKPAPQQPAPQAHAPQSAPRVVAPQSQAPQPPRAAALQPQQQARPQAAQPARTSAPSPAPQQNRPAAAAQQPANRSSGFSARPVPPESDSFFVAPTLGNPPARTMPAPASEPRIDPSRAKARSPSTPVTMEEIESLIGEAVRVEMDRVPGNLSPEPPMSEAPVRQQQPRQSAPAPAPVATPPAPPRRANLKAEPAQTSPQSAEAAILAAAAATGAEVGMIPDAVIADEPRARRTKKAKPARVAKARPGRASGGARQYVGLAVAATLLIAAGLGLYWVLGGNHGSDAANAPVLTADATPAKQPAPASVASTEPRSPVLDQIDGTTPPADQEALVSTDDASDDVASAETDSTTESGLANRKVRTVTVRPDGTIVATDNATAGAQTLPVARPNVPSVPGESVTPSDLLTAAANSVAGNDAISSVIANGAGAGQDSTTTASTDVASTEPQTQALALMAPGATPTPSGVVAPVPMARPANRGSLAGQPRATATASAKPVTAEVEAPQQTLSTATTSGGQPIDLLAQPAGQDTGATQTASAAPVAATPEPAADAAAYVQLSSQRNEGDARASAKTILARYGSLFGGNQLQIHRADLGAKGIYYRVRLPAGSHAEAQRICQQVQGAGGTCFVP